MHKANGSFTLATESATKQVFLNPQLHKELTSTRKLSSSGFDVCRVLAKVGISDGEQVFDELQPIPNASSVSRRDYLFVLPKEYKL